MLTPASVPPTSANMSFGKMANSTHTHTHSLSLSLSDSDRRDYREEIINVRSQFWFRFVTEIQHLMSYLVVIIGHCQRDSWKIPSLKQCGDEGILNTNQSMKSEIANRVATFS